MKIKIAKVSLSVHEVEVKAKCPHCSNMITDYDGDKMHADVVTLSRDSVYLDPKRAREKEEPFHFMGENEMEDEVYVTTLTCGKCGEIIVGKDTIVEPMTEREREHAKHLMQQLMEPWSAAG